MRRTVDEILHEALELPPDERAALAGSLIESLDEGFDADAEAAWDAEIARRVAGIDAGAVRLIPWADARDRIAGR
jgi:putative addiction module component (TIGR02574 family)